MRHDIYLDLDGVCVDFIGAALRAHALDPEPLMARWARDHPGEFFPDKVLDFGMEQFWAVLNEHGETFWRSLEPYPWFENLFESLNQLGHVVFCTATTRDPACVSGKLHWLQDQFGTEFRDYIFTPHKDRLAHDRAFLVDDFDDNIADFNRRGGHGILFPQFWNAHHEVTDHPVPFTLAAIEARL